MMVELIIFAVIFVALQTGATVLLWHIAMQKFMSEEYLKDMTKKMVKITGEITEELLKEE